MAANFTYKTLDIADDYEGKVIATLIESNQNTGKRPAILHIHGFIDFFFHPHVADAFCANGYDFYAIELRKYAHSLLPHQHPNYCKSLEEYFEELTLAIDIIYKKTAQPIVILGHSTGALLACLYMNRGSKRNLISHIILNSPFLEFNTRPKIVRTLGKLIAGPLSTLIPYFNLKDAVSPVYPISLHKDYEGEWEFDLQWKPIEGYPAFYSWINAVNKAQNEMKHHSAIEVPVLLLHSSASFRPKSYTEAAQTADIVLDVADMKKYGPRLGSTVKLIEIKDAKHDVFLSNKTAREKAINACINWLKA